MGNINISRRNLLRKAGVGVASTTAAGVGLSATANPVEASKEKAWCEETDEYRACVYKPTRRVRRPNAPTNRRIYVGNAKVYRIGSGSPEFNLHAGSWVERRRGRRYYYVWLWESKLLHRNQVIRARSPRQLAQRTGAVLVRWFAEARRRAINAKLAVAIGKLVAAGISLIVSIILAPFLS